MADIRKLIAKVRETGFVVNEPGSEITRKMHPENIEKPHNDVDFTKKKITSFRIKPTCGPTEANESIYAWATLGFMGNLFSKQIQMLGNCVKMSYKIWSRRRTNNGRYTKVYCKGSWNWFHCWCCGCVHVSMNINLSLFSRIEDFTYRIALNFCKKISAVRLIKFNWFMGWSRMPIRFVFVLLDAPETVWLCRFCQKKKSIFRMKLSFILVGTLISNIAVYLGLSQDPQVILQRPMHPFCVTVWCSLWSRSTIGPYLFENLDITLNEDTNRTIITDFLVSALVSTGCCNLPYISCHKRYIVLSV